MNHFSKLRFGGLVLVLAIVGVLGFKFVEDKNVENKQSEYIICELDKDIAEKQLAKDKNLGKEPEKPTKIESNQIISDELQKMILEEDKNPTENTHGEEVKDIVLGVAPKAAEKEDKSIIKQIETADNEAIDEINKQKEAELESKKQYEEGRRKEVPTIEEAYANAGEEYFRNLEIERQKQLEKQWTPVEAVRVNNVEVVKDNKNQDTTIKADYDTEKDPKANQHPLNLNKTHVKDRSIYVPTGLSAESFNKLLKDTGMEGLGQSFVDMENKWEVDGLFCMAVAFHESAKGTSSLAKNKNNLFGMKASRNSWRSFKTKGDAIMYFGEYMNKDLYKGKTTYQIGKIYCPPNTGKWIEALNKYYQGFVSELE